jgi:tetratricopeptide (TPR) repeat protein
MTAGLYSKGLRIYDRARERQVAVKPDFEKETYTQFVYMLPVMAMVRLGKWDEVLASEAPDPNWKYAVVLDNFAKGIASLRRNDRVKARQHLAGLNEAIKDESLAVRYMPFNSPLTSCRIASELLNAELLSAEGKSAEATNAYQKAVEEEDRLVYREPQDWLIPARQYFGAALLKMNKAAEAQKVFEEDLIMNPGNGWSLLGMYQSLKAQGKTAEASVFETKYKKAFEESDVKVMGSVF